MESRRPCADGIAVIAHVDGQVVGTGSLGIEDAMGQVHAGESIWRRAQGHIRYTYGILREEWRG